MKLRKIYDAAVWTAGGLLGQLTSRLMQAVTHALRNQGDKVPPINEAVFWPKVDADYLALGDRFYHGEKGSVKSANLAVFYYIEAVKKGSTEAVTLLYDVEIGLSKMIKDKRTGSAGFIETEGELVELVGTIQSALIKIYQIPSEEVDTQPDKTISTPRL